MNHKLTYLHGFNNYFESEALNQTLIHGRNSPQKVPHGLYAEQISGSSFAAPRHQNQSSWLYRIRPSVKHGEFKLAQHEHLDSGPFDPTFTPPTQMRWDPIPYPTKPCHFIEGMLTWLGNGSPDSHVGTAIHLYHANNSMQNEYFYNADGELLVVPQEGKLRFITEFGLLDVAPGEIILIPRGIKFQVQLLEEKARGYICENYGQPFRLPDAGIIGTNALARARDFQIPTASFEERCGNFKLFAKFQGKLWETTIEHSPIDVAAWHGNYVPSKYNLSLFNTLGTVSFDHPDPSIFTVLSSPSSTPGISNVDFVIFPPRWMVATDTFRPPYFHRNIMSEYMGLIQGSYDAKPNGFVPGGGSLHNCMSAHGPDAESYRAALANTQQPEYYDNTLAFMFESRQAWRLTPQAYNSPARQKNYITCWQHLDSHFEIGATVK
jgi:homogentisate 1,2-dioxygenase